MTNTIIGEYMEKLKMMLSSNDTFYELMMLSDLSYTCLYKWILMYRQKYISVKWYLKWAL